MSDQGLWYFAGTEVANPARVLAYRGIAATGAACACAPPGSIGDEPYVSPALDPAPWYEAADPASAGFGGVWVESVEGLAGSTFGREVSQRLGDGAVVSRGRRAARSLTFTAWLFAVDCCSADYGLRWLSAALASACRGCAGDELCFLTCCPEVTSEAAGGVLGPDGRYWNTPEVTRTLLRSALVSGPTVIDRAVGCEPSACGGTRPMYQVQWVMTADPCVWRQPVALVDRVPWPEPTGDEPCNIVWTTDCCDTQRPGCVCVGPCQGDPGCPEPEPPPVAPPADPDCVCIPFNTVGQCVDVDPSEVPVWEEAQLVIRVWAGSAPLRNLTITVWPNNLDRPGEDLDDCQACGTYYVTHVPASSTLVIDGRTCSATLSCPGQVTQDAGNSVYGSAGGPLSCVSLSCGFRYTVCADVDVLNVAPDASLSVEIVRCEGSG